MNPEQRFILSCRQAGQAASRLSDWLEHNRLLLGTAHVAVCDDITCLAAALTPLAAAAEVPPAVALISTAPQLKFELLFQLLAIQHQTVVGELGQRPMDETTIRSLLPAAHIASRCAVLRFATSPPPPAPRGFPIQMGLLTVTEIATILAEAWMSNRLPGTPLPALDELLTVFPGLQSNLSPQALPGLSGQDIRSLRDQLESRWPDDPALAILNASRYWDEFHQIAPHLPDRDRRRLLALLWNNDPSFTLIFNRLCEGIDKLGQGASTYAPAEALLGKDKASGWLTRHPRSLIDDATLRALDATSGPQVAMMNRYGQTVDIDRAVAAGLVSEMTLHLAPAGLDALAPAELLDFPVPPQMTGLPPAAARSEAEAQSNALGMAVASFARQKAIFLFERACSRRDVTSLIVVVDPNQEDDTYAAAIGDWVEMAQGPTAHARERVRRGLFIAAAASTGDTNSEERVRFVLTDIIGANQEWPTAWTPNRPLSAVHWFNPSELYNPGSGTALTPASQINAVGALTAGPAAAERAEVNTARLVSTLSQVTNANSKQLQLHQALGEKRRLMRQAVLRHHLSNDPAALSLWRRSTAVVVQDRLQYLMSKKRLGKLHRSLMPTEASLTVPVRAARQAAQKKALIASNTSPWLASAPPGANSDVTAMCETAVAHWFRCMRRAARSPRLCRELQIEMSVMNNLVDELQIGAIRCGVAAEIANAYLRSSPAGRNGTAVPATADGEDDGKALIRLSAYASRIINAYLEVLATNPARETGPSLATAGAGTEVDIAAERTSGYASHITRSMTSGRRRARPALNQWEFSFVTLVEENIASAHMMAGRGDKDRELGELIQLFASGPFEVDA